MAAEEQAGSEGEAAAESAAKKRPDLLKQQEWPEEVEQLQGSLLKVSLPPYYKQMLDQYSLALSSSLLSFQAGNIKHCFPMWKALTSDREILEMVSGLPIEFLDDVVPEFAMPYERPFNSVQDSFISNEISTLLKKGVLLVVPHEPGEVISPIFLTDKSDGSFRLILNLKRLNLHVPCYHFKMETISSILKLIRKGDFMSKLDIKDAYYSVPIAPACQKFLRFQHHGRLFQFQVLPNGFSPGPRKFTKLLKPPLAKLRQELITVASYIDDLITAARSFDRCFHNILRIVDLLSELGFFINVEKSEMVPSQVMEYLGFIIDSVNMSIRITPDKVSNISELCREALASENISIREVARLLGKFASCLIAVRFGKLHYRNLERCKVLALSKSRGNFDKPMILSDEARLDIEWWLNNVSDSFNCISTPNPDCVLSSDACDYGWGAVSEDLGSTGGLFNVYESSLHINVKELLGGLFGLQCFHSQDSDIHIKMLLDNTTAVQSINKMGSTRSPQVDDVVREIWHWAIPRNIWLSASHIPGVLNEEADAESRKSEVRSEWKLSNDSFNLVLDRLEFTPVVDLFASRLNTQLDCFVSYRPDPEATHIDAFSIDWGSMPFYAFPPFSCVSQCIQKIFQDQACGILIVPNWPNQVWFPEVMQCSNMPHVLLPARKDLLFLPTHPSMCHPIWDRLPLIAVLASGKR